MSSSCACCRGGGSRDDVATVLARSLVSLTAKLLSFDYHSKGVGSNPTGSTVSCATLRGVSLVRIVDVFEGYGGLISPARGATTPSMLTVEPDIAQGGRSQGGLSSFEPSRDRSDVQYDVAP